MHWSLADQSIGNDEVTTKNLVATWKKSKVSKELYRLLPSIEVAPASPVKGKRKRKRGDDIEPVAESPEIRATQPSVDVSTGVRNNQSMNRTAPWPVFDSIERSGLIVFRQLPGVFSANWAHVDLNTL